MSILPAAVTIVVTGTPGTGKSTVGRILARLMGYRFIDLDNILSREKVVRTDSRRGIPVVSPEFTPDMLPPGVDGEKLVLATLYPDAVNWVKPEIVAVLRCDPLILRYRLEAKGYGPEKILENLEAEIVGFLSLLSLEVFGWESITEIETSRGSPAESARGIIERIRTGGGRGTSISWLHREDLVVRLRYSVYGRGRKTLGRPS